MRREDVAAVKSAKRAVRLERRRLQRRCLLTWPFGHLWEPLPDGDPRILGLPADGKSYGEIFACTGGWCSVCHKPYMTWSGGGSYD